MSKMTRPQLVVAQLFYPAFLGNMTYEAANKLFADKLFNASANFDWMARFVVLALLAHFVLDWVYTVDEDSPPRPYSFAKGVFDTVMVLCLYVAVRLVLNLDTALFEPCPGLREPALWLLVAKLVAVGWELTEWAYLKKPAPWPRIKGCELGLDLGFVCSTSSLYSRCGVCRAGVWDLA